MKLIHGAAQVVTPMSGGGFRVIEDGAIAWENGTIAFVGKSAEAVSSFPAADKVSATGKVLLPGFVDAHTHLIFAGDRANEFLMRLRGATYQEIAAGGGGIQSTVRATREASEMQLLVAARLDLQRMIENGTTTVEVKSGYGLSWPQEQKLLKVANALKSESALDIAVTFLGAHDFPREKSREDYVHEIVSQMLPSVVEERLAEFCDVFHDQGYYDAEQTQRISHAAEALGLKIKLHVDELADVNGAMLAAELKAISADHLILANETGIKRLAESGVVGVLLPGTSFSLRAPKHAPARTMIDAGVRVAIATDFNPGTCYCHSMQYILQLATLLYRMTAEEAITAATLHGAAAVDRAHLTGSLEAGKYMDCLIFDIPHYAYLFYNLGANRLATVIKKGKVLWTKKRNPI
jgi:imidazolonepropionase